MAGAGDVNGVGFTDVIVGAPVYDNGQLDEGAAFVYFGGARAPGAQTSTRPFWLPEKSAAFELGPEIFDFPRFILAW